jgi:L-fucose isomerase-like protein
MANRGEHWREFDQLGPIDVRRRIEHALYDDEKRKEAYAWLDEVEHGPERALMKEQARVALSAARAAWIAAATAIVAAIIAVISIPGVLTWIIGLISSFSSR